jgi:hypothetical protein
MERNFRVYAYDLDAAKDSEGVFTYFMLALTCEGHFCHLHGQHS